MSDKSEHEWVVRSTRQNGEVFYGSPTTKAIADAWVKRMNQDYPFIKHEATLVDLVPETDVAAAKESE